MSGWRGAGFLLLLLHFVETNISLLEGGRTQQTKQTERAAGGMSSLLEARAGTGRSRQNRVEMRFGLMTGADEDSFLFNVLVLNLEF